MRSPRGSTVGCRELKTRLGSYLRKVRTGVTLVVTERGLPVAELRPIGTGTGTLEDRLTALAATGVISWSGALRKLPDVPRPLETDGRSVSSALHEDREDRF